jgi:hypothetical protein
MINATFLYCCTAVTREDRQSVLPDVTGELLGPFAPMKCVS